MRNWARAVRLLAVVMVQCDELLSQVQLLTFELNETSLRR